MMKNLARRIMPLASRQLCTRSGSLRMEASLAFKVHEFARSGDVDNILKIKRENPEVAADLNHVFPVNPNPEDTLRSGWWTPTQIATWNDHDVIAAELIKWQYPGIDASPFYSRLLAEMNVMFAPLAGHQFTAPCSDQSGFEDKTQLGFVAKRGEEDGYLKKWRTMWSSPDTVLTQAIRGNDILAVQASRHLNESNIFPMRYSLGYYSQEGMVVRDSAVMTAVKCGNIRALRELSRWTINKRSRVGLEGSHAVWFGSESDFRLYGEHVPAGKFDEHQVDSMLYAIDHDQDMARALYGILRQNSLSKYPENLQELPGRDDISGWYLSDESSDDLAEQSEDKMKWYFGGGA